MAGAARDRSALLVCLGQLAAASDYGIRGIGDKRAYVWGNRGVRIKTTEGEVFWGHDDPERIVRDLDAIKLSSRVT